MERTENGGQGGERMFFHCKNRELRQKSEVWFVLVWFFCQEKANAVRCDFSLNNLKFNDPSHLIPESSTDKMLP